MNDTETEQTDESNTQSTSTRSQTYIAPPLSSHQESNTQSTSTCSQTCIEPPPSSHQESNTQPNRFPKSRRNMTPYGRNLTQRSTEVLSDHKQKLIQSQINVQDLLAKEITLRCRKAEMQFDVMRQQKRVELKKLLLEEKKTDLELLKIERELHLFRSTAIDNNQNNN